MELIDKYLLVKGENKEFLKLYNFIKDNLDFPYIIKDDYNMINFSIPFSYFADGYHVKPKVELPFISIAIQKNHIAFYHMGIYMFNDVYENFVKEYSIKYGKKPDIGKSCIRFKGEIPYDLILKIINEIPVDLYIEQYKKVRDKK